MKTTGNTIFISGGSAGIGLAIAKKLNAEGNKIIINGRSEERLQAALSHLDGAVAIKGDWAEASERERIAEELKTNHPDVNIIVNNAGIAFAYLLSQDADALEKAQIEMNLNYFSVIHFNQLMMPHLLQKEEAAVVNVSSLAVYGSEKFLPTYCPTKAALHNYTLALRATYEENKNIQVYEVYPPRTDTEFSSYLDGDKGVPAAEVAEELFIGLQNNRFDVPVGETKIYAAAINEAMSKIINQSK
ncbi:SDR family oxidoreductase [Pedobacter sp. SL55]|uniref:SDR family oxidoreductase n=1 Tax=Pedobacter sp. SL55 TaxID=2995161 RepID=UPI00226DF171|nr:SDR family NAD(P)-dependent oxidoreductase [Pedobacter sp. SL55]WAC40706.1 SDR family NAD(P)-dependent oxidoreductase [Pedobacter sp. SL55]